MATKNIARTAIEGGRNWRNKWERRYSNRCVRSRERDQLLRLIQDPETVDSFTIRRRAKVYPEFNDKLNPVRQWLASQVGAPWADVYRRIRGEFDFGTTAGRHIVGHIRQYVNTREEEPTYYSFTCYHGVRVGGRRVSNYDFDIGLDGRLIDTRQDGSHVASGHRDRCARCEVARQTYTSPYAGEYALIAMLTELGTTLLRRRRWRQAKKEHYADR